MLRQLPGSFASQKGTAASDIQAEEKLLFSELRYRRLFETAQDGILIMDADSGKIADANPYLKRILGYSQEELLGKDLWEIGVFKDVIDSKAAFLQLQTNGYIRYKDLPLQTKDGQSIDVEFVSNVYMVGNHKVIQCNIRDITDRKKAEDAIESRTQELESLTRSQEETKKALLNVMEDLEEAKSVIEVEKAKDEALLTSIGEGLIAVDNDKKIVIVNKAAEQTLGWKMKDLVDKKITSLRLENEQGHLIPFDKRPAAIALSTGRMTTTSYFYVRRDKTRIPIAITVTPILLGGKTTGAVVIFRDITREKEIDRAKSEFVSLASHQLRTPLGIAKWYLEALENEEYITRAPSIIREYFDEIYKNNERVLSLVRDLLSVSRIEQGRIRNVPKSVDLIQVVGKIVKQMQIVAHKKRVNLHLAIQNQKIPPITLDIIRFHEVIENLISNAVEYSEALDTIDVTINKVQGSILIQVKDTGIGISEADQKKLFTKFFRSKKASIKNTEGTGLGLYVVKSYVTAWGGGISVESSEGKGSTFSVTLPLSAKNKMKESQ